MSCSMWDGQGERLAPRHLRAAVGVVEHAPAMTTPHRPTVEQFVRYGEQVWSWQQVVDTGDGRPPRCTCWSWTVTCP
jgi:hypothetical protein